MIENVARLMRTHLVLFVVFRDEELESAGRPRSRVDADDVSRAVIAERLLHAARGGGARLRRLGAQIVDAPAEGLGSDLLNRYLDVKRREPGLMAELQLKSARFRAEREADWRRLEAPAGQGRGRRRGASSTRDELLEIPVLYRQALSSLSRGALDLAGPEPDGLSREPVHAGLFHRLWRADAAAGAAAAVLPARLAGGGAGAVAREPWCRSCMLGGRDVVAYVLVRRDADWFYSFVEPGMASGRDPTAPRPTLRETPVPPAGAAAKGLLGVRQPSCSRTTPRSRCSPSRWVRCCACRPRALMVMNGAMLGAFLALFVVARPGLSRRAAG